MPSSAIALAHILEEGRSPEWVATAPRGSGGPAKVLVESAILYESAATGLAAKSADEAKALRDRAAVLRRLAAVPAAANPGYQLACLILQGMLEPMHQKVLQHVVSSYLRSAATQL
jgi:hypothetical protein